MKKIYLAGPEVFLPNAAEVLRDRKYSCAHRGFAGLSPFDSEIGEIKRRDLDLARRIFFGNVELIRTCDLVIANCNPFRGACVDDGTAFEIGYAYSLGKRIYGFARSLVSLPRIVTEKIPVFPHNSGYPIDEDGYLLNEDFGNSLNLMLEFSISTSGGVLVEGDFEDCLSRLAERER
ncbi:nucleoside 2-deoxyribosyltransferase [Leptospira gomenensis]|uniref:Nucleoside 2-deoxyribosyltransferase n=1 Tax=Leptospira gomenensis TaxID=2484974 RepID=A0A5F1YLX9_9LEPT|nr:nucleoside 2-deoxyribosyltransferase [Leptospira gomenensis]TGK33741.1 nucleoside 2-deoxyribosyltransferase [Leptospira gomenensis]TGK41984.1 nucleoside 2-deoxyribosyltransferase [Leptospira gomenensis]TGK44194.1 nucleoside 2-deoxyribosyltransferase [Leptospira gomenensis]TGK57982.1 nucleoside 2-deoxyribosyltransferase [Leptospira gomenensis]